MKQFSNITIKLFIAVLTLGLFLTLGATSAHATTVTWDGGASGSITINNAGITKKASAVWYDDNFVVTLSLILNLKSFLMAA